MFALRGFQLLQLTGEVFVGSQEFAESDKGADK